MILTERHIIKEGHQSYEECAELCFKSKNIYNYSLYNIRQYFFEHKKYIGVKALYHIVKGSDCYVALKRKVSNQTIKKADASFRSFFALLKKKKKGEYKKPIKIPGYLDIENGKYVCTFEKQAISSLLFKKQGLLHLSGTNIKVKTKIKEWDNIKEVRIVPKRISCVIEVVYNKPVFSSYRCKKGVCASIDPGLNNLATVAFNDKTATPFYINGRPLKSINQYYNKKLAGYKSELEISNGKKTSKRILKLTDKRNNKINDYLHKASRYLVNQLVSNKIECLILGKNKEMKQGINIGKANNQNFVHLPIMRFLNLIKYKAELEGISAVFQEESYTSKCSFLDREPVKKHEKYAGKRPKRGLFRSAKGYFINADLNGAYNIMRKAIPNAFVEGIEGFAVSPASAKADAKRFYGFL